AGLALALRERGLSVGVCKPVQTGALAGDPEGDAMTLARLARLDDDPDEIAPLCLERPLAPLVAAEGRVAGVDALVEPVRVLAARRDLVLVEGIGGILVPVAPDVSVGDLAARLGFPVVVVGRAGLGTINHTLLTLAACRTLGLDVAGVVLN